MPNDALLTPQEVVQKLLAFGRALDAAVDELREAERLAVASRHAADMAESRAFVNAEGSMEMRKHLARLEAGELEEKALVAEAVVRHLRRKISSIDTQIEIGRSYGVAVRAELKTLGYQEG